MIAKKIQKNKGLLQAFLGYQKRSGSRGKKINWKKFLPEIIYRTMRLEGEHMTRKEARSLFR
jgi:hypothetical protein